MRLPRTAARPVSIMTTKIMIVSIVSHPFAEVVLCCCPAHIALVIVVIVMVNATTVDCNSSLAWLHPMTVPVAAFPVMWLWLSMWLCWQCRYRCQRLVPVVRAGVTLRAAYVPFYVTNQLSHTVPILTRRRLLCLERAGPMH